jgi:hypothetical protein
MVIAAYGVQMQNHSIMFASATYIYIAIELKIRLPNWAIMVIAAYGVQIQNQSITFVSATYMYSK